MKKSTVIIIISLLSLCILILGFPFGSAMYLSNYHIRSIWRDKEIIESLVDDFFYDSITKGDNNITEMMERNYHVSENNPIYNPTLASKVWDVKNYKSYKGFILNNVEIDGLNVLPHFTLKYFEGEPAEIYGIIQFGTGEVRRIAVKIVYHNNQWQLISIDYITFTTSNELYNN
jgi:ASC-1-like (ASCH) protein